MLIEHCLSAETLIKVSFSQGDINNIPIAWKINRFYNILKSRSKDWVSYEFAHKKKMEEILINILRSLYHQ